MATFAGQVEVPVVPDLDRFRERLEAEGTPAAVKAAERIGQQMGQIIARQVADGVAKGLSSGRSTTAGAKAGQEFGKAFATGANASIKAGLRDQKVRVLGDFSDVTRGTVKANAELAKLSDKRVTISADTDFGTATGALAAFNAEVSRVDGRTVTVNVDVDGGAAAAQIAGIGAAAGGSTSRMTALILAAAALGPALIPIGGAAVAAFGAVAAGATAAAAGVGVLALALVPVFGALQAVRAAQEQSAQASRSSVSNAFAQASAQDALKAAVERVARAKRDAAEAEEAADRRIIDAEQALEDAGRDSARARNDGAKRVADAQRDLADTVARAAERQATAARRVQDADRSLASAQRGVLDAQQRLNDARAEASRRLEDLQSRAANGALDERRAVRELAAAEKELRRSSGRNREENQLAYDEAVQRLKDIQTENKRTAAEQDRASKAGVDGADEVLAAQQALTDAKQRQADAERDVAEAATEAAKQRVQAERDVQDAVRARAEAEIAAARASEDADRRVADAQRDVSDALVAAQRQQTASAEAIADAQQAVVQAHRGVAQAAQSAGAAGGTAMETARRKLAALAPEGRAFVAFLQDEMIPAFGGLSKTAQAGFLPGLQAGLAALLPVMPQIRASVADVSAALGDLAESAGKALAGPWWNQFLTWVGQMTGPVLTLMGQTLGAFAQSLGGLMQAFEPVAMGFGRALLDMARSFADFGETAGSNAGFQGFMRYLIETGPRVAAFFAAFSAAVGNIVRAMAPWGTVILSVVTGLLGMVAAVPPGVLEAVLLAVTGLFLAFKAWAIILPVVNTALAIMNGTLAVNPVMLVVIAVIALGAALVAAYHHSETFRAVVQAVWETVRTVVVTAWTDYIWPALQALAAFLRDEVGPVFVWLYENAVRPAWAGIVLAVQVGWAVVKVVFEAIWGFIRDTLIPAFQTYLLPAIQLTWALVRTAISLAWSVIQVIFAAIVFTVRTILGPVFTWLYETIVKPVWDKIYAAVKFTWDLLRPVFDAVGSYVRDEVAPAFQAGVEIVKAAWESIGEAAKTPVRFMIESVINKGIIGTWNKIAGYFGVKAVEPVDVPGWLQPTKKALGGEIPATAGTPGVDSVPALLMPNEHVWTTREVKGAGGHANVARLRALAAAGLLPAFATGGPVGLMSDPIGWFKDKTGGFVDRMKSLGDNPFVELLTAIPRKLISAAIERITGLFGVGGSKDLGGQGWQQQWAAVRAQFPWAQLFSSYRPGAVTVSGNASWHSKGRAIDTNPSMEIFNWILANYGQTSKELIFTPAGDRQIKNGQPYLYGGDVAAGHLDHVHWAYDQGGYLPRGLSLAYNGTGRPEPTLPGDQLDSVLSRIEGLAGRPSISADVKVYNPVPETASESTTRVMRRLAVLGPA